jgi:hypothetical protein
MNGGGCVRELSGSTRRRVWTRATGVLLVACGAAAAREWRGTPVGVLALIVVAAAAGLALTSGQWRSWARRHRAADFYFSIAIIGVIGKLGAAEFTPWNLSRCALAAAALLTALACVAAWLRGVRRPAAGQARTNGAG